MLSIVGFGQLRHLRQNFHDWEDLMDSVQGCSQVCKNVMLYNHALQQRLYGLRQRLCSLQVLVGLFGVSLRTLGMSPGCHGAVPLQQPTLNLIGYCTGKPPCCPCCVPFVISWRHEELPAALQSDQNAHEETRQIVIDRLLHAGKVALLLTCLRLRWLVYRIRNAACSGKKMS